MNAKVLANYQALLSQAEAELSSRGGAKLTQIQVGSATCENAAGAVLVREELEKHIQASGRNDIQIQEVGCTGRCSREPIIRITLPGQDAVTYQQVTREKVHEVFMSHVASGKPLEKYSLTESCDKEDPSKKPTHHKTSAQEALEKYPMTRHFFERYGNLPFYCAQSRIALRNAGMINPLSIGEYIYYANGFSALTKVLDKNDPEWVINEVTKSNLRGRGGGGFPTGKKWQFARANKETVRYIICNADEGDPGAFMDRSMLESDPFGVIEGMMIGGFAIGAHKGFFYIRAEYPLAVERTRKAIEICREKGLLGKNILGSGFDFDLEIRLGAGAFVCGEETALIHSIEGERGQPRLRPPYPAVKGLWGKPTVINNVETFANVPAVIEIGAEVFAKIGTEKSGGTKVFALAGKVRHTGLVEVPMGTTLREIVFDVGGGVPGGKQVKAVQTGGPAGGFIPAKLLDTPIDYDTLAKVGSIMGSGGMIVLDENDCMVDVAKFFLTFTQDESCGKCTPCREGTTRMLEILTRITEGKGTMDDIDRLERLAKLVHKASLCGLGRAAPNPVLSTLREFRDEYIAHVVDKKCPAGKCTALIHYEIDAKKCVGCTACAKACPVKCIAGERKQAHVIDQNACVKCGNCFNVCRFGAVLKK